MPTSWSVLQAMIQACGSAEPAPAQRRALAPELRASLDELERVGSESGGLVAGVRRGRILAWDERSRAWEGVETRTGHRVLVVTGREPFGPFTARDGAWVSAPMGISLADTLPADDLDAVELARIVLGVVESARDADRAGMVLGATSPDLIVRTVDRWLSLGTGMAGTHADDLRSIGALAFSLDPEDETGLGAALSGAPQDVEQAVGVALGTALTGQRHIVARRERNRRKADKSGQLREVVRRLQTVLKPPVGAGRVGQRHTLISDGRIVRGGAGTDLPLLYDGRMDAVLIRAILRAWATWGADPELEPLLRWLRGMSRLRVDARLLDR